MVKKEDVMDKFASAEVDWVDWLSRWDEQQTGYLPYREMRFEAMLEILGQLLPPHFTAVDLASGPGSISQRVLARFPHAECIAADYDPLLLALGQAALGDADGRLRWVELDLVEDVDLKDALGVEQVDAVLSTTALHWLPVDSLVRVYEKVGRFVREGGLVLNGDNIPFAPHLSAFQKVANRVREREEKAGFGEDGREDWEEWWDALTDIPVTQELAVERERRFGSRPRGFPSPVVDVHEAALRHAGFRQVSTIWQRFDDRIIMAVK